MPKQMTYEEFARWIKRLGPRLAVEVARAEAANVKAAKRIAVRLSSGGVPTAWLSHLGHPYAKGFGGAGLDPSIANKQSDAFRSAWLTYPPATNLATGAIETRLVNTSQEAHWFDPRPRPVGIGKDGTRYTKDRPLVQRVIDENAPERERLLKRALDRALNLP
jgi:hypothetical protein